MTGTQPQFFPQATPRIEKLPGALVVSFFVPGIPKTAGSKRGFVLRRKGGEIIRRPNGAPVVVITDDAGKPGKEWKQQVALFARQAFTQPPLAIPLEVSFTFFRTRPKAHFNSKGEVKDWALQEWPGTKPDVLKLTRSAEDALTGICWVDDAQICREILTKTYSDRPGVEIAIYRIGQMVHRTKPVTEENA
jgi:Holliday junction resolvase RusA-like endonuclease